MLRFILRLEFLIYNRGGIILWLKLLSYLIVEIPLKGVCKQLRMTLTSSIQQWESLTDQLTKW